jgi:general secretion pathway protein G
MKRRTSSTQAGFTLLEIMLVVAIIVLLLGAAAYNLMPQLGIAKAARAQGDIQAISTAILSYSSQNRGRPPTTAQGLDALVNRPNSDPKPQSWMPCMDKIPLDPWGTAYIYKYPGTHKTTSGFDLYSAGPDHIPDNEDDIVNWDR